MHVCACAMASLGNCFSMVWILCSCLYYKKVVKKNGRILFGPVHIYGLLRWRSHSGVVCDLIQLFLICRKYNHPPTPVRTLMEAICALFGYGKSWPDARNCLSSPDFVKNLLQYDVTAMSEKVSTMFVFCGVLLLTVGCTDKEALLAKTVVGSY